MCLHSVVRDGRVVADRTNPSPRSLSVENSRKKFIWTGSDREGRPIVTFKFIYNENSHKIALMKLETTSNRRKSIVLRPKDFDNFEIILCSGFGTLKTVNFIKNKYHLVNNFLFYLLKITKY